MSRLAMLMLAVGLFYPATVLACAVCNPEIRLTPALSICFMDRAEELITDAQGNSNGVLLVSLADCEGASPYRMGQVLPDRHTPTMTADVKFLLDVRGLACLRDFLAGDEVIWDPVAVFKYREHCRG